MQSNKLNKADHFFFEELNRTVGREQSLQWVLYEAEKSVSPTRSPVRSPPRSPSRSPHASPPVSPRGRPADSAHPPPRKYVAPEGGSIRRNWNSFSQKDTSISTFVDEDMRGKSSSPKSPCVSLDHFNHSFSGLDMQQLSNIAASVCAGDCARHEKLCLIYTDAAHSVLD